MRKGYLLFICFMICFSVFSGCSRVNTVGKQETEGEKTLLTWQVWISTFSEKESFPKIWEKPLNQLLKEKNLPYEVKIEAYYDLSSDLEDGEESAAKKLQDVKDQGKPVDIISVSMINIFPDYKEYPYREMVKMGLLEPLRDYLHGDKGEKLQNAVPKWQLKRAQINGENYGISACLSRYHGTAYQKKYLEQYGIAPETLSGDVFENEDIFQKAAKQSGGTVIPHWRVPSSGQRDSWGYMEDENTDFMALSADGVYVNFYETEEWKEYVHRLKEWRDSGLFAEAGSVDTPEFLAVSDDAVGEQPYESTYPGYHGYALEQQEYIIDTVVVPDLSNPVLAPYPAETATAIAAWSQNKEMAFDFLTQLYTDPDIANLIQYGVEGEDYHLEDGYAVYEEDNMLRFYGEYYTNPLITWPQPGMPKDRYGMVEECYRKFEKNMPAGFRFDPEPVQEEIAQTHLLFAGENNRQSKLYRDLCSGDVEEVDQALQEFNQQLKAAGSDKVLTEANRQLEEWRRLQ